MWWSVMLTMVRMCVAREHRFECVGCESTVTGTMTIRQFCRRKEDVEAMTGRFIFPGTDEAVVFPKAGEEADYYEGQEEDRANSEVHNPTSDTIIPHRYFRVKAVFVGARFCKDCLEAKHKKDQGTMKQLDRDLVRVYRDTIDVTFDKHVEWLKELASGDEAKDDVNEELKIFDGERCYHVPGAFDSKFYDGPVRCDIM
ncbi:hypothetical protein F503_03629 [Ophiostoma piceae UAMH 11346]|uniref:Uncharacterized protein n=1 Tax=Ophiostoma piceae (strain UAMH 11346) TaxID=1262450 RepID=S3BVI5_OPHP1|nr:hypothetical protein F503_03629 [Ophiostoma piceae UAMH 11346]